MKTRNLISRYTVYLLASVLIPALADAATDSGTLTVGHYTVRLPPPIQQCVYVISGYQNGIVGVYSPTTLTGGKSVYIVYDAAHCSGAFMFASFEVSGFSSDPGQNWLTSVTCNGVTNSVVSSYAYDSTRQLASWEFATPFGLAAKSAGTNVACTIVHS